jgi:hypothetical protein
MARLGFIFYSGCALGVLVLALSCASGNNANGDAGPNIFKDGAMTGDSKVNPEEAGAVGTCGNNKKEGTEVCDGTDFAGATCASLGHGGGTLGCVKTCTNYDTSMCTNGTGGAGAGGGAGSAGIDGGPKSDGGGTYGH